jgi:signal transduction histidine kinase
MGMTALARTRPTPPNSAAASRRERRRSLLALLNDILDLSKVEAGKLRLAEDSFDVHQCVRDAVATLRRAAERASGCRRSSRPTCRGRRRRQAARPPGRREPARQRHQVHEAGE